MTIISEIPPSSFFFEIPAEMRGFFIDFFQKNVIIKKPNFTGVLEIATFLQHFQNKNPETLINKRLQDEKQCRQWDLKFLRSGSIWCVHSIYYTVFEGFQVLFCVFVGLQSVFNLQHFLQHFRAQEKLPASPLRADSRSPGTRHPFSLISR